jgi:fused signal recognition particle receptor
VEITDDVIEDIEEILVEADIGMETTQIIIDRLEEAINEKTIQDMDGVKTLLKTILMEILGDIEGTPLLEGVTDKPAVIIVVGVNGVGKTTTIGKLAAQYRLDGKSVLIAAADTFRAGAIEQVEIWAKKVGVHIVKHSPGSDPAAVVYDSLKAAKARNTDIVIVDTAGRLHTKFNLMEEVKKIHRIIQRELPGAPHEVLQVIDATTGQNGLIQAKKFLESTNVTGIALTKLDGTAKGGIVVAITKELKIPIKLIGIGEGVTDLRPFKGSEFVNALFD